ncbi:MAG TPA: hypothetical protein VIE13_05545 [Terriglobales bacterium]
MMAVVGSVIVAVTILWSIGLSFLILGAILDAIFGERLLAAKPRTGWHFHRRRARARA